MVWSFALGWRKVALLSSIFLDRVHTMASPDYTGNPWSGCVCGSTWILLPVAFDGDELNSYGTVGFCCDCGARITVPTPERED